MDSSPLPRVSRKILQYLDMIDEGSGKAKRMDFLRIAGNEEILNDWVDYLVKCNLVKFEVIDDRIIYLKTDIGQKLHEVLKLHYYLGPLMRDLSRDRRRPK